MNKSFLPLLTLTLTASLGLSACNNTQPLQQSATTNVASIVNNKAHNEVTKNASHSDSHEATWEYMGDKGPEYWGDLEGNEQCKIGSEQSPINITQVYETQGNAPQIKFGTSDIIVTNNGHTIVYTPKDANNTTLINGDIYTLKQFHYHTPSEHQVSGVNYPAEIHFVHANNDGNLAVIGVMLNPTAPTAALGKLINSSQLTTQSGHPEMVNGVDLNKLLPTDASFYHYAGSLTTPPCSEKVQWYVADKPLSVSSSELSIMTNLYEGNNRPVQPQGNREVTYLDSE